VNGIACGGAFYMLGEVEFIIAADHATFFDPHVTYGMTPVFEPIHVRQKMPFHEIMRVSLLGNHERMSAQRAYEIGFVSEVTPLAELRERAQWAADAIASAPRARHGRRGARALDGARALTQAGARHGLLADPYRQRPGQHLRRSGEVRRRSAHRAEDPVARG
jgi:enoyl-CoA hydratase/carnithine racemase